MTGLGQLRLEFGDRGRTTHQLGLGRGDLLGGLPLLRLGDLLDLVAVLDRVGDQLLDRVQVRVAHRGQLDRRQVEVVLDTVLDAHRHQRIQPELDQRHLPRKVLGLIAHRRTDDRAEPLTDGLPGVRRPLREAGRQARSRGQVVLQDRRAVLFGLGFWCRSGDLGDGAGTDGGRQRGLRTAARHDRVVDEREGLVDPRVHLHAGTTRVAGQRRHQPGALGGHRTLLGRGQLGIRKYGCGSGFHESGQGLSVDGAPPDVLPHVPAVRGGDVVARHHRGAVAGEAHVEPVRLAPEPGRRDVGVVHRRVQRPVLRQREQRPEVQVVPVHEQVRHRRGHRVDLVLLARERRNQLRVMQSRRGGGQTHLHQRHRVGRQLQERGVPVVDGVTDAVREVHAVAQTLLPVVHVVDRFRAGPHQRALVHRRVVRHLHGVRLDALQFGGEFTEQRVHLRGVAGALGLELAGELALRFGAGDDRVHLVGRTADDGLGRCGVHAHFEVLVIGEHGLDLVGRVLDQRHQPDVFAEQHRLALTHQVGARADGAGRVLQRQTAGEVRGRGLAERLPDQRTGFRAVRLEHLAERDLDREDDQLHLLDREVGGLVGVVDRIVEDHLDDRTTALVLDQRVHLVDPLGERVVVQIQALGHLAVLGTESGEHPHRAVGDRAVGGDHDRVRLAVGDRAQTLDRLVMVVGEHDGARPTVVAP